MVQSFISSFKLASLSLLPYGPTHLNLHYIDEIFLILQVISFCFVHCLVRPWCDVLIIHLIQTQSIRNVHCTCRTAPFERLSKTNLRHLRKSWHFHYHRAALANINLDCMKQIEIFRWWLFSLPFLQLPLSKGF